MHKSLKKILGVLACSTSLFTSSLCFADGGEKTAQADAQAKQGENAQAKISLETVIAKVNGKPIKMVELVQLLQELPPQLQQVPLEKIFPRLRNQLVDSRLIAEVARKQKLGDSESVKQAIAKATERALIQAYMMKTIKERVTESVLKAAYEKYTKEFKSEKEIHAYHILVKDEETAKKIIQDLQKGGDFGALAKEHSIDPTTAKDGGDLGFFGRNDMVSAFSDVAFNLKSGSYTETPVKTEFGYHVILVKDSRDSKIEPFEKKQDELANAVSQEVVMKTLESLRSSAKVELFDEKGQPAQDDVEEKKEAGPRAHKG